MTSESRLNTVFTKYMSGDTSAEEAYEFIALVNDPGNEAAIKDLMDRYIERTVFFNGLDQAGQDDILNRILNTDGSTRSSKVPVVQRYGRWRKFIPLWKRLAFAAMLIIMVSVPASEYFNYKLQKRSADLPFRGSGASFSNTAVLTLSDGKQLRLAAAKNGALAEQNGITVIKVAEGKLVYKRKEDFIPGRGLQFNKLTTPAGRQYRLVLPDGTRVWLNALSSLSFPVSFLPSAPRRVFLSGEAYFEVARSGHANHSLPFIVDFKDQQVKVLGTHFNVSCYPEELASKTTLLEGKVVVSKEGSGKKILRPGQQAVVNSKITIATIDTSAAVAWKNGLFKFEDADIITVMHQFSRWYDLDVKFEGDIPENRFNGELYRNIGVVDALEILHLSKINFSMESRDPQSGRMKIVIRGKQTKRNH